jgi:hypothetical protein
MSGVFGVLPPVFSKKEQGNPKHKRKKKIQKSQGVAPEVG